MKKKGFTLVELLVVISIIALLMGFLMPALARVRMLARRMHCGSNLSGIGKAMLVYSQDYEGDFPVAGDKAAYWSTAASLDQAGGNWDLFAPSINPPLVASWVAYGSNQGYDADVTVSSSLYLLIKYADVTPKQFVCGGDKGTKPLQLTAGCTVNKFEDAWDFGGSEPTEVGLPGTHCSYSYHMPYFAPNGDPGFPIGTSSLTTGVFASDTAVAADRNPFLDKNKTGLNYGPRADLDDPGNLSASHENEGQNVLYRDMSVSFQKTAYCGPNGDNIWRYDPDPAAPLNEVAPTAVGDGAPTNQNDSYLVNQYNQ